MNGIVATVGKPNGPKIYVPELGCEVATFTDKPEGNVPALRYHVPFDKRGPFRPEQLANYDEEREYRTDYHGYVLCYARTQLGEACKRQAENRFPRCNVHGGRLHPMDRLVKQKKEPEGAQPKPLSRYQQFLAKQITIDDLDDEEILSFGFRKPNGGIFKPRNIPREIINEFTKAIYDRALSEIKVNAVEAAKTLASIMTDTNNDASIRLKAAEAILDRSIGKAPQQLNITAGAPWEEIFESITTATRQQSRAARGDIIDVDVVTPSGSTELELSSLPANPPADLPDALK